MGYMHHQPTRQVGRQGRRECPPGHNHAGHDATAPGAEPVDATKRGMSG